MRVGGGRGGNWGARHLDPPLGEGRLGEGGVGVEPRIYNTRSDTVPSVNTVVLRDKSKHCNVPYNNSIRVLRIFC